jgi:hypothetical protein
VAQSGYESVMDAIEALEDLALSVDDEAFDDEAYDDESFDDGESLVERRRRRRRPSRRGPGPSSSRVGGDVAAELRSIRMELQAQGRVVKEAISALGKVQKRVTQVERQNKSLRDSLPLLFILPALTTPAGITVPTTPAGSGGIRLTGDSLATPGTTATLDIPANTKLATAGGSNPFTLLLPMMLLGGGLGGSQSSDGSGGGSSSGGMEALLPILLLTTLNKP